MHFIQLLLQILHLLADRRLPDHLLVVLIPHGGALLAELCHFQRLVDHPLQQIRPACGAVFREDRILLFIGFVHPGGEGAGHVPDGMQLAEPGPGGFAPLGVLRIFLQIVLELAGPSGGFLGREVLRLLAL